jgi:competence ComEA-like helix-hairpin-helix protein
VPVLTPSERRGALVLLALCALGAGWDLLHARPAAAPMLESTATAPAGAEDAGPAAASGERPAERRLDLNLATAGQLDELPGIGPVLASRIVEHRRRAGAFRSADELLAVRGIGPHLLERLRPLVAAGAPRAPVPADTLQIAMPSGR